MKLGSIICFLFGSGVEKAVAGNGFGLAFKVVDSVLPSCDYGKALLLCDLAIGSKIS